MTEYNCEYCDYNTKIRTHYQRHLTTNKHIKNSGGELEKGINGSYITTKIPQKTAYLGEKGIKLHKNTTKNHKNTTKNHIFQKYTKKYECKYCLKKYSRIDSLNRHIKEICKAKKEKDIEDQQNKEEIDLLKTQIDKLIDKVGTKTYNTNIGNTLNNNVQLNYFGKENLSMLTKDVKYQLIRGPFKMMPKLLEMIYFNKNYPENHTIKMVNKNKDVMKIHKKTGWELVDKKDTVEYMLEDKNYEVDSFFDNNIKEFSKFVNKTYKNFRILFDSRDKELWNQIKRDVDLLLWNNM